MREWIIECSRPITLEDVQKGIIGARLCKSFIVRAETEEQAREKVRIPEGFIVESVEDWGRIKDENLKASLKWMWDH